jgi:hypothetical protein
MDLQGAGHHHDCHQDVPHLHHNCEDFGHGVDPWHHLCSSPRQETSGWNTNLIQEGVGSSSVFVMTLSHQSEYLYMWTH